MNDDEGGLTAEAAAAAKGPPDPGVFEKIAVAGGIEEARLADNEARSAAAALPRHNLRFRKGQAAELVAEFRRTRDGHRGRYAAPVEELPADPERVATAIMRAVHETRDDAELKHLAEDLVDLQAFVDLNGERSPLPPERGSAASAILEFVAWRQAAAIHYLRNDPSVVGAKVAQKGAWTPIGDSRVALQRTSDYRDDQASGFLGVLVWPFAAPAGAVIGQALGWGTMTVAVWIVLAVAWFGSPLVGIAALKPIEPLLEGLEKRTQIVETLPNVLVLPLLVAPPAIISVVLGALVVAAQGRIGI